MKKGIIVEIKNKQKVVLSDSGRFYVTALKKGDKVGARANIGLQRKHFVAVWVCSIFCTAAFFAGMATMKSLNAEVPQVLAHICAVDEQKTYAVMEFVANGEGKILSAAPVDNQAEIVFYGESFERLPIEQAISVYLSAAVSYGIVDVQQGGYVSVNSYHQRESHALAIQQRMVESVQRYALDRKIKLAPVKTVYSLPPSYVVADCEQSFVFPIYTAGRIEQYSDSQRDMQSILRSLKTQPSYKIMNKIKNAHIKYLQGLDFAKREQLRQFKQQLKQLPVSTEGYIASIDEYQKWLQQAPHMFNALPPQQLVYLNNGDS